MHTCTQVFLKSFLSLWSSIYYITYFSDLDFFSHAFGDFVRNCTLTMKGFLDFKSRYSIVFLKSKTNFKGSICFDRSSRWHIICNIVYYYYYLTLYRLNQWKQSKIEYHGGLGQNLNGLPISNSNVSKFNAAENRV